MSAAYNLTPDKAKQIEEMKYVGKKYDWKMKTIHIVIYILYNSINSIFKNLEKLLLINK